jgi:lipoprotein-releasing system permease protein
MFELSVAKKYLIPKGKQLSNTLIAVMSVTVISLVVWLVLVFLSVTDGMERSWLHKLTSLNAPVRINPTETFFSSYYYQIDALSSQSHFHHKTIGEKRESPLSDPYLEQEDGELPSFFPKPDSTPSGALKDPVKEAFAVLEGMKAKHPDLAFQDYELSGALLKIGLSKAQHENASFLFFPPDKNGRQGIVLAKNFQESGVQLGDQGYLAYQAASIASVSEQRIPVYVAGFYDPGVMSVGNRCLLVPASITQTINASSNSFAFDQTASNGILVWFKDLTQAEAFKQEINRHFIDRGIDSYWKVSTFREYDFAKALLEQFQSDKYLFTLLASIILLVACCNIISLLVLLVNDKKREIGILQSMGASTKSIMLIFGTCGCAMGLISCLLGIGSAFLTMRNIDMIVQFLSFLQGHEAFNVAFYGKSLPTQLSTDALVFVLIATPLLSLCAGLVPAIKACRLKASVILRSE